MIAPTTREKADHAELARIEDVADWFESGDPGTNGSVLLSASVAAEHARDLRFILSEIAALRGERDAEREENTRWCLRMADIREASGIGVKPMLDEVPEELRKLRDSRDEAVGLLTDLANDLASAPRNGEATPDAFTRIRMRARVILSGLEASQ